MNGKSIIDGSEKVLCAVHDSDHLVYCEMFSNPSFVTAFLDSPFPLQVTQPVAQLFVSMGHNVTVNTTSESGEEVPTTFYGRGVKDICAVFFYMLVAVVMHAVCQVSALDL